MYGCLLFLMIYLRLAAAYWVPFHNKSRRSMFPPLLGENQTDTLLVSHDADASTECSTSEKNPEASHLRPYRVLPFKNVQPMSSHCYERKSGSSYVPETAKARETKVTDSNKNEHDPSKNESDSRVSQPDSRMNEPDPRMNEPDSRMNEPDSRMDEPDSRMNEPDSRMNQPDSRMNEPDSRMDKLDLGKNEPESSKEQPEWSRNEPDASKSESDSSNKNSDSNNNESDSSKNESGSSKKEPPSLPELIVRPLAFERVDDETADGHSELEAEGMMDDNYHKCNTSSRVFRRICVVDNGEIMQLPPA
ncbi:hypothetical protein PCANC_14981 [Puccinia coronata f. sp. avenae]|uniref:Uncharacterized protein n=1 Tax=Puccinia coronata f. sp. avenae TaxID=200324 RepID=A0A2N5TET2_9BASI|nr:hypothetical protein PCANC_14981 [Puccinia coronata f. sp. avenae]PLW23991.1 hypothetical protein PCASD_11002 [Puccinia coronata f. sp. avenae]PLW50844.1 hypothetical protein PCASD_01154 [Puccinia coronata f. sp. avenae]